MPLPTVGLTEVDRLIMQASERNIVFPPGAARWAILAWAAEALEMKRADPATFERGGLEEISRRHFPTTNPPPTPPPR